MHFDFYLNSMIFTNFMRSSDETMVQFLLLVFRESAACSYINVLIVGVGMPKAMLLVISPDPRKRHTLFCPFQPNM